MTAIEAAVVRPMLPINWSQITMAVDRLADTLRTNLTNEQQSMLRAVHGIPRGGHVPAAMLAQRLGLPLVDDLVLADRHVLIVDDIIDSGRTAATYAEAGHTVCALYGRPWAPSTDYHVAQRTEGWLVFPWEDANEQAGPADAVVRLLQHIGDDPNREGLIDTPARVLRSLTELTRGLHTDPASHLRCTFDGDEYDELIVVRNVPFTSLCEHHLLPFTGSATIGYLPADGRIVGLSKLPRVLDGYARRPQVQERLTQQVARAINDVLEPQGVGVVITAHHTCMSMRGIRKQGEMVTSAMLGAFREVAPLRAEFMALHG